MDAQQTQLQKEQQNAVAIDDELLSQYQELERHQLQLSSSLANSNLAVHQQKEKEKKIDKNYKIAENNTNKAEFMHNSSKSFWGYVKSYFTKPKLNKIPGDNEAENDQYDPQSRLGIDRSNYSNELDYQRDLALYNAKNNNEDVNNLHGGVKDSNKRLNDIDKTSERVEKKLTKLNKDIEKRLK